MNPDLLLVEGLARRSSCRDSLQSWVGDRWNSTIRSEREKAYAGLALEFGRELSRGRGLRQIFTCGSRPLFFRRSDLDVPVRDSACLASQTGLHA